MATTLSPTSCATCGKEDSKHCARCQSIRYCGTQCQKADYTTHKLLCRPFSEFVASTRPSPDHLRAILFPEDEQKPKLIWLHCPWVDDEGGYRVPDTKPLLRAFVSSTRVEVNNRLKRGISSPVYFSYRDAFLSDGSQLNQCIRAITNASTTPHWRGPVVACGCERIRGDTETARDVTLSDFRHLVDYFDQWDVKSRDDMEYLENSYGFKTVSLNDGVKDTSSNRTNGSVSGVRINCAGDVQVCKRPKFEAVQLSPSDAVFTGTTNRDRWTSDIADRIGLPVFTRKYRHDSTWAGSDSPSGGSHKNNQEATFLHQNCEDRPGEFFGWGWVPSAWQWGCGSVLVARQDATPLHPWHVEALSEYCFDVVQPIFEAALEACPSRDPTDPRTVEVRDAALARISRRNFLDTWWAVSDRNQVPSPYSV